MRSGSGIERRALLRGGAFGAAALVVGCARKGIAEPASAKGQEREAEVGPVEDLMREHGVLRRVLLVYGEAERRLDAGEELPPDVVMRGARLVRTFVEDYHEKMEEQFVFPRFEKRGELVDLVKVLRAQHEAGRHVTDRVLALATAEGLRDAGKRRELAAELRSFARMYRPHAAREDTVLFPALHRIVSASEFDALGDEFEEREHQMFGEDGFEKGVADVAELEKALGIDELPRFTSR